MRNITKHWKSFTAIAFAALAFGVTVDATAAPARHDGAHRYDARHRHHRVVPHRRVVHHPVHHPVHHRVAGRAY